MEKYGQTTVFRAAMAGLGIYHMGGYGRIGVYRVKRGFFKVFVDGSVNHINLETNSDKIVSSGVLGREVSQSETV